MKVHDHSAGTPDAGARVGGYPSGQPALVKKLLCMKQSHHGCGWEVFPIEKGDDLFLVPKSGFHVSIC